MSIDFGFDSYWRRFLPVGVYLLLSLSNSTGDAQQPVGDLVIAATVNGEHIHYSEVQRELRTALGKREIAESAVPYFQAKSLAQLIDRQLIVQWLRKSKRGASDTEIDLEISRLEKQLQSRATTLAAHLKSIDITEPEMRRLIEWQIGWRKFLARYLTDQNLEKYFNDHRSDFDGTRMRVAHILFKIEGDDQTDVDRTKKRAAEIRNAITNGSLSFEDAAKAHSSAPTATKGGDIGFIKRHEPMHESFSRAAFALKEGEISLPTVTPFGVHLIRCVAVEPGQRTWQEVREELGTAVTGYLFDWAAEKERPQATIRYTKTTPHFVHGTDELAP